MNQSQVPSIPSADEDSVESQEHEVLLQEIRDQLVQFHNLHLNTGSLSVTAVTEALQSGTSTALYELKRLQTLTERAFLSNPTIDIHIHSFYLWRDIALYAHLAPHSTMLPEAKYTATEAARSFHNLFIPSQPHIPPPLTMQRLAVVGNEMERQVSVFLSNSQYGLARSQQHEYSKGVLLHLITEAVLYIDNYPDISSKQTEINAIHQTYKMHLDACIDFIGCFRRFPALQAIADSDDSLCEPGVFTTDYYDIAVFKRNPLNAKL